MINLTHNDRKMLMMSLRVGMGLTRTCHGLNWKVEEVSAYLRKYPSFLMQCRLITLHGTALIRSMSVGKKSLNDLDIETVNLWESYCKKEEFNAEMFQKILPILKDLQEIGTATGYTVQEFYDFIYSDVNITKYLLQNGYLP